MNLSEQIQEELKKLDVFVVNFKSESVDKVKNERAIIHYITTKDMDWGNDVVNPKGMSSDMFDKHRTVFFNHNYSQPIASNMWHKPDENGVLAKTRFAKTLFADDIYSMHEDGIINTWSIGWQPKIRNGKLVEGAITFDEGKNIKYINLWDLVEYSSAPLAMNPSALDQIKTYAKSLEMKDLVSKHEAKFIIQKSVDEHQSKIILLNDTIEKQKQLIEDQSTRIEILEADYTDLKHLFDTQLEAIRKEVTETLGKVKAVNYDELIAREVSQRIKFHV